LQRKDYYTPKMAFVNSFFPSDLESFFLSLKDMEPIGVGALERSRTAGVYFKNVKAEMPAAAVGADKPFFPAYARVRLHDRH